MSTTQPQAILLTGVTGFLGRHLLWDCLRRDANVTVYCLLRPENHRSAEERLAALIARHRDVLPDGASARCHAVSGDIAMPDLGLDPRARERLLGEVDRIVHCAATVEFDTPLAESRRINVGGTQQVLHLADELLARGRLGRVDYFSTAFVAGKSIGRAYEDRLIPASFNNTYEQTKWEAEQLVRAAQPRLPITIYRPSIIVGDSKTGYTSNFRVLYWPLKALATGLIIAVPADPNGVVDVVPIDHVVDAFAALSRSEQTLGKCYHLAAGVDRQSSFGELLQLTSAFFGVRAPWTIPPQISYRLVRPVLYATVWGKRRELLRVGEMYFPYFSYRASFDRTTARADLDGTGIDPPAVADYFHAIMQYCVDTDWGRAQG